MQEERCVICVLVAWALQVVMKICYVKIKYYRIQNRSLWYPKLYTGKFRWSVIYLDKLVTVWKVVKNPKEKFWREAHLVHLCQYGLKFDGVKHFGIISYNHHSYLTLLNCPHDVVPKLYATVHLWSNVLYESPKYLTLVETAYRYKLTIITAGLICFMINSSNSRKQF